jgi:hypothetical protein
MAWIVGLVAVIGFAWLMFVNENFRRFGFGVLALIGAAIVILWFLGEKESRSRDAERALALSAIPASQLSFTNLQLADQGYGWRLTGNVVNRSAYPLRQLTIRVFLQNCPSATSQQDCITTGQDDAIFYVEVPAGQARQLDTSVTLANAASLGSAWSWQYAVTQIEADLDRNPN